MEQARIVVVSDDRGFVDSIAQSLQRLRFSTEIALAGTRAAGEFARCAVVLTDDAAVLSRLDAEVVLAIAICGGTPGEDDGEALLGKASGLRVVWIPRTGGWADQAAVLAQETILRLDAQAQVAELKQRLQELERFAAVGRFILEARHGLGNALTGVMGHSELLLLEAGTGLQGHVRGQLETIHAMSLKMHETFHRLTSLDTELRLTERQAERARDAG